MMLTIGSILVAFVGIIFSVTKIRMSMAAEEKLKKLIRKDHQMSVQIVKSFRSALEKGQEREWGIVEDKLKEEIHSLDNASEQRVLLDMLDNNTEMGKKRYINTFVASL